MLHACLLPITLCFTGTCWCFYGFSATNILRRCHSASFCFLLFLIPEKLKNKYSRNRKRSYFTKFRTGRLQKPEGGTRGGPQEAHTLPRRAQGRCGPPGPLLAPPFRLFIPPGPTTLKK